MSEYREYESLLDEDKFTFKDSKVIRRLLESKKLTERQKLAVQRLYRTYQYMVD